MAPSLKKREAPSETTRGKEEEAEEGEIEEGEIEEGELAPPSKKPREAKDADMTKMGDDATA
jgi:hypothetical protein